MSVAVAVSGSLFVAVVSDVLRVLRFDVLLCCCVCD